MTTVLVERDHTSRPAVAAPRAASGAWVHLGVIVLVLAAWQVSRAQWFKAGDDLSYWIAVTGGTMMLVLLLYPLRKYVRVMRNLGRVKGWFVMHMVFGILGPWLILVHSTFRIGSLNAGVALVSMLIVVCSGIVGRFIYVRIHRGLSGERSSLRELQAEAGLAGTEALSQLDFAPAVEEKLLAFERTLLEGTPGLAAQLRRVVWLPVVQRYMVRRCMSALEAPLLTRAHAAAWPPDELVRRRRHARVLVRSYLESVVRVAQFGAYERIFALWHVAHLPFVILLGVSAVVHVVAVHAY